MKARDEALTDGAFSGARAKTIADGVSHAGRHAPRKQSIMTNPSGVVSDQGL